MFKSNCQITLYRRSVLHNGTFAYDSGEAVSGFFMEHWRTLANGKSEDFSEVLLAPEASPLPGDQLEIKGLRRNIARVRSCTGADGSLKCFRCSFMRD
jgi:hypothetical protein